MIYRVMSLIFALLFSCVLIAACAENKNDPAVTTSKNVGQPRITESVNIITWQPDDQVVIVNGVLPNWELDDIVKVSDVILLGTVLEILPPQRGIQGIGNTARSIIYTDVIIKPDELYYGQGINSNIAIRIQGGKIGHEALIASDEPKFNIGEKAVLFLFRPTSFGLSPLTPVPSGISPQDYFCVSGSALGKWVYKDGLATDLKGKQHIIVEIESSIAALRVE